MSTEWEIDELAHAGDEHLDPAFVAAYDAKQQTDPTEDVETLLALGVDGTATVVDLGSGTGTFALAIAPHVRRVVAADVSPAMVAYLRQRVTGAGLDNVTVVQAGFTSYRHDGIPADVVHTRNALHQIPDFHKGLALARIAEILRLGGILFLRDIVYDFEPDEAEEAIAAWFAGAVVPPPPGTPPQTSPSMSGPSTRHTDSASKRCSPTPASQCEKPPFDAERMPATCANEPAERRRLGLDRHGPARFAGEVFSLSSPLGVGVTKAVRRRNLWG